MLDRIDAHLAAVSALRARITEIEELADRVARCLEQGGKLLACGNGGSAADAQHLAAELVGRFSAERPGIPALALVADSAILTAVGNDYGFERVFARQVESLAQAGDCLLAISTSGNSANVLTAVATANRLGVLTVALTGPSGGRLAAAVDCCLAVPGDDTARVQECHGLVIHLLAGEIERRLCGD